MSNNNGKTWRKGDVEENPTKTDPSQELKFSREQGFFDKNLGVRLLIGLLFAACVFLLLHFREVRVEVLELNHVASSYVVAQVDFEFLDEGATLILKQEAVRDIGKIYRFSEKEVRRRHADFEREWLHSGEWRQHIASESFEKISNGEDRLMKVLLNARFTDPKTFQEMNRKGIPTENYRVFTPAEENVPIMLPESIWRQLEETPLWGDEEDEEIARFIIKNFKEKSWRVKEDVSIQLAVQKRIQAVVLEKYTEVSAGSRIIDKGEKVTARHIAMLQAMKRALSERRNLWHPLTLMGTLIMTTLLTVICAAYFRFNHTRTLGSNRKLFLLVTIVVLTLLFSKAVEFFLLNARSDWFEAVRYPIFVPFAAILTRNLLSARVAAFTSVFLTIILAMTLAFDESEFMVINISAAFIAILTTHSLRKRKEIFVVCGKAWLACVAAVFSIHFYEQSLFNFSMVVDLLSTGLFMLVTAVMVVGLLPLFEFVFHIMTDVTLMEYMDPNHELLKRLSMQAPGTYQHSVVVGSLAEVAALGIGANGLFCRVAALFHDIGKMAMPEYFTENQQGNMNIHQLLTPLESARVIMAHVSEGVSMARKAGLPEQIIDIIKEHHGTTLVYYFYRKQLELAGGDKALVDEKDFRYAGPKPRSKESAIIMIADSVEAASRSLEKVDEKTLTELIDRLTKEKAEDGQFDECLLTFEEVNIVKKTITKTLAAAVHSRVKYPNKK